MSAIEIVASVFLVTGSALCLLVAVGLQRFDSVFARMHSATKAVTLGLLLVCVGAALLIDDAGDRVKLLLVAALQFMTAPVAAHGVGRAAYRSGTELPTDVVIDELADDLAEGPGQAADDEP
jgi:multicomponent Na+:H+ antiporter subunit G